MNVWIMLSFTKNIVQLVQNLWTIQVCECFVGAYTTNMIKILSHQFVYAGGRRAAALLRPHSSRASGGLY